MLGTTAIRNLIREDKIAQMFSTIQTSSTAGMCTLDQYLERLVSKKIISPTSARDSTSNKNMFHTETASGM